MTSKHSRTYLLCSFILALAPSVLFAQGRPPASQPEGDWKSQLGLGVLFKPKYEGSSNYDVWPIPYFEFEYKRHLYISPYRGIGYKSKLSDGFSYDLGVGFDFGRDEEDGDLLLGMGDIDFSGALRAGLSYDFGSAELGVRMKKAVTGAHDGYELEASLGRSFFVREWKTMFRFALNATYASEDYLQTYFGVNAAQSLSSGHPVYAMDAGLKEVGVSTMIIRRLNPQWSLLFLANYGKFVGDVADSPVVESSNRMFGGMFMVRSF